MNAPASHAPLPPTLVDALAKRFGARFSTAAGVRDHHGRDESPYAPMPPDAVVFAESTDDVAAVVVLAAAHRVPVIPYGVGSSIEGHLLAVHGGISIDLSHMNAVLAVNAEDLTVTAQAGITRKQLNTAIKDTGLFFPIDPGADATIGGMAATRASGTNAVRYGTMRENVLALTVVTAEGKVIRTARRAKKSSAGYDLTRIFVGSEGTLGIITEVTLKLYPQPEAISAATCSFPSVDAAVQTTIATIQLGVPIARCELLDALTVKAVNQRDRLGLPELPLLLFEFHGSPASVEEQAKTVQEIAAEHGGEGFQWATQPEDRTRLWEARHNAYFACLQLKPGCRSFTTDVCVPISRLAECITETIADTEASFLPAPILGHVGDGNFHCAILANADDPREVEEAERLNTRIVERAIAMDGTCTGEHGVGMHKMGFLRAEHGDDALDLMMRLKRAFDPLNILNPGKIV
ncbi:MAG TPA: FAD-linked oxidase C-terminal domain-containing protein, partial [Burkholderiaceae bacterium]|nr:FAD-linked oxidase C-terminal domain-containing protein [Burkholderiaceae bacterium]